MTRLEEILPPGAIRCPDECDAQSATGAAFERQILDLLKAEKRRGTLTGCRYGVQASFRPNGEGGNDWQPSESLPDFEGVFPGGRQWLVDAKRCAQPAYPLTGGTGKSFHARQYPHMVERSGYGVPSGLLIHFAGRSTKKIRHLPFTVLLPVDGRMRLWQRVDAGELKSVNRELAARVGIPVRWTLPTERSRKLRPDMATALAWLRDKLDSGTLFKED